MRLKEKVAVITGAASGIGRSMARRFADEGAKLVLADLDERRLDKVMAEMSDKGTEAAKLLVDVSNRAQVEGMIQTAVDRYGRLDVLCNNAGVLDNLAPLGETTDELWDKVMGVNCSGPFYATRAALKLMVEQGSGSIVNTSSAAGDHGGRGGASYTVSKHALMGMTRSVAWFYGPKGIRCNAIAPGAIQTRIQMSVVPSGEAFERYQQYFPTIPAHGKAAEVAEVALFLASDESSYVNGALIPVDGGWVSY
ncbi:MAG: glucose 1-dehydrogenase [Myxococcota bacterium]